MTPAPNRVARPRRRRLLLIWLAVGTVIKAAALIGALGLLFPPFKP